MKRVCDRWVAHQGELHLLLESPSCLANLSLGDTPRRMSDLVALQDNLASLFAYVQLARTDTGTKLHLVWIHSDEHSSGYRA